MFKMLFTEDNLALVKPAIQSSTYDNKKAVLAVDGNRRTDYDFGSCSHTLKERNPWWAVDMLHEQWVEEVVITNREESGKQDNIVHT